eukprot:CAMPEP_0172484954 /NCGR_PEP_ID=MMETSP1066-20121228/12661_1 /TAXON_ID=671091 /ORGANISM="Coscinodiscus wailesii, Strain CCMP2513" /LENGTH=244 /DNA_ID=CAMNT_0013249817 /DNA_START=251 /DNA_END=985 /DNA_ORIENTATION=+
MVGFPERFEDSNFALEVTYNYGIRNYDKGKMSIKSIVLGSETKEEEEMFLTRAKDAGFVVMAEENTIIGPDGYCYEIREMEDGNRTERFLSVGFYISQSSLEKTLQFYNENLQLETLLKSDNYVRLGNSDRPHDDVAIELYWNDDEEMRESQPTSFSGRMCLCQSNVSQTYDACVETLGDVCILHKKDTLKDKLGDLEIGIVKDCNGYEICLVTGEVFGKLARSATDLKGPNWRTRKENGAIDD